MRTISASVVRVGSCAKSRSGLMLGVLISTVPSIPNSELAEMPLPSVRLSFSASPKYRQH